MSQTADVTPAVSDAPKAAPTEKPVAKEKEDVLGFTKGPPPDIDEIIKKEIEAEKKAEKGNTPAKEKKPAKAPADEKPSGGDEEATEEEVPAALLNRARDLDWSTEEIQEFESVKALERAVRLAERAKPKASAAAPKPAETKSDEEAEDEIPDLDPSEYDEKVAKFSKVANKKLKAQEERNKALEAKVEALSKSQQAREEQALEAELDGLFDALPDEHQEYFGKGKMRELEAGSSQSKARIEAVRLLLAMEKLAMEEGRSVDRKKFMSVASRAVLGDTADKLVLKKIGASFEKRTRTNPPTQRDGNENLTREERARRHEARKRYELEAKNRD